MTSCCMHATRREPRVVCGASDAADGVRSPAAWLTTVMFRKRVDASPWSFTLLHGRRRRKMRASAQRFGRVRSGRAGRAVLHASARIADAGGGERCSLRHGSRAPVAANLRENASIGVTSSGDKLARNVTCFSVANACSPAAMKRLRLAALHHVDGLERLWEIPSAWCAGGLHRSQIPEDFLNKFGATVRAT